MVKKSPDLKATPNLKNIFSKKEEIKEEKSESKIPIQDGQNETVTFDQITEQLAKYVKEKTLAQSLKIVLSKTVTFTNGTVITFPISNKVEISMMQNIEQPLLDYLRNNLKNNLLSIEYNVSENNEERRPYTSSEIFEAMAKKNPAILKLKDDMGLDTEY
ncbi:MAG: hypothetical protein JXR07_05065 [Reichenbachiella sp.]